MSLPDLLTTNQVAAELSVTPSRVRQLVRDGRLSPESYDTHVHLFKRESVDAYKTADRPPKGRPKKV